MHIIILYVVDTAFPAYQGHHNTWPYLPIFIMLFLKINISKIFHFKLCQLPLPLMVCITSSSTHMHINTYTSRVKKKEKSSTGSIDHVAEKMTNRK